MEVWINLKRSVLVLSDSGKIAIILQRSWPTAILKTWYENRDITINENQLLTSVDIMTDDDGKLSATNLRT